MFLNDLAQHRRFADWSLPVEVVDQALGKEPNMSFASAVDAVFRAYAGRVGKTRWADKTPAYIDHVDLLISLFPDAGFVHLIRDGRDVALSVLDMGTRHRGPATVAMSWRRTIRKGRAARDLLEEKRWLDLKYEQLVADPMTSLRSVCAFAGLEFEPDMVSDATAGLPKVPTARQYLHQNLDRPITRGRDWRSQMDEAHVLAFEAVAGRELTRSGYELSGLSVTPIRFFRAWWDVATFPLSRRLRSVRAVRHTQRAATRASG